MTIERQQDDKALARLQARQQLVVLTVLIAVYSTLPVVLALDFVWQLVFGRAASGAGAPLIDVNPLIEFVNPLVSAKGSVLEALHKLILPLAALFLGANFVTLTNRRLSAWLFLVPLAGTIAALLGASLLDAFPSIEIKLKYTGLAPLLRDVASNLAVVMMLLVGQNIGGKK